jgi:PBSX family phage terminase large subunit
MTAEVAPLVGKAKRSVELCTARINVFEGSVRSGKTVASLLAWLLYLRTGPAGNLLMVGRTERTLRQNVIDPLTEMLGRKRCKVVWGDGVATILGRRVYLVGANDEKSVQKIQGLTLAGAYVDEATILPESFWSMLLTRLSVEGARLYCTCNPASRNHWMMRRYLRRSRLHLEHDGSIRRSDGTRTLDLHRFSFNLRDNPSLPAAYVDELSRTFVGLFYQRFILGLWVLAEGAIWDMWDQDRHMADTLPTDRRGRVLLDSWTLAVDYGTTNPFVALLLGVGEGDDDKPRIWVAGEWRWDSAEEGRQLTDADS